MTLARDLVDMQSYRAATTVNDPISLSHLADHPEHWVRTRVASNPHTAKADLLKLAHDRDTTVRANAACNKNLPLDTVLQVEASVQWERNESLLITLIQAAIASRRDCPESVYWRLFETRRFGVLLSLAHNPALPHELGTALSELASRDDGERWREISQIAAKRWNIKKPPEE